MFLFAAILCLAVLVLGGAADLMESLLSADELDKMGIHER